MKLLYGQDAYTIFSHLEKIKKSFNGEIVFFDSESSLQEIINNIKTHNLFTKKKLIIIQDHSFFKSKTESNQILNWVKTNINDISFIFVFFSETLPINDLFSFLRLNSDITYCPKITNKNVFNKIKQIVIDEEGEISDLAIYKLIEKLPLDLWIIKSEIKKLLILKKNIDVYDVDNFVTYYASNKSFSLVNAIFNKDNNLIYKSYLDHIRLGGEITLLISQIAYWLENSILFYKYKTQNKTNYEIANLMGIHNFQLKTFEQSLINYKIEKIYSFLEKLINLDEKIKLGTIEPKYGFERFLINFFE